MTNVQNGGTIKTTEGLKDNSSGGKSMDMDDLNLTNSENGGIIQLGTSKFVNSNDQLYHNADKIKPLDGFDDIVIHGTPNSLLIYGNNDEEWEYNTEQAVDLIRASRAFSNRPIRLISCNAGQGENCIAQQISDLLGVDVMAPTETVFVDTDGEIFISNNKALAEIWNISSDDERKKIHSTEKWILFKPRKG